MAFALAMGISLSWIGGDLSIVRAADATEDELNKQGVEARKRGDDTAALTLFQKAYQVRRTPRAAAQMGLAEIALGRWSDADTHLREALAGTSDPWIQKNEKVLRETLARVQSEFGSLHVLGSPDGAQLVIEGKVEGTLPMNKPVRVRTGECRFEVRAAGHVSVTRVVQIGSKSLRRETVELAPVSAAAAAMATATNPPSAPVSTDGEKAAASNGQASAPANSGDLPADAPGKPGEQAGPGSLRPYAWVAAVGAAGGIIFGSVQTVIALNKKSEFDNHMGPHPTEPLTFIEDCETSMLSAQCRPIQEAHNRAVKLAIVGYAVGGALAIGSIVLFVLSADREKSERPAKSALACVPDIFSNGIACQLRF